MPSPVIFLHIPKTGGITLQSVINAQYPAERVYSIGADINADIRRLRALPEAERHRLQVVQGHMSFGLHQFLAPGARYVTILRDPVARALSDYYYVTGTPGHPLHPAVRGMRLADYLDSGLTGQLSNGQTRLLSGDHLNGDPGIPGTAPMTADDLERAKANLRTHFAVAGMQEEFETTLCLMARVLGWRLRHYTRRNVGPRSGRPAVREDDILLIRERNALDLELYDFARSTFAEHVRNQGTGLQLERWRLRIAQRAWRWRATLGRWAAGGPGPGA
jgi:hypothetical protein